MKKYIIPFIAAALCFYGCKDYSYETWNPDTTLNRTGEVSLLATFENLETKVFIDEKGHGTWVAGDEIAVACSDGSFVTFPLDGTGDTTRAVFTGTIPAGKQLGSVAIYPAEAAVSLSGPDLTLQLKDNIPAAVSTTYPGVLVGEIGENWEVNFKQAFGFLNLALSNFPGEAVKIELSSPAGPMSGTFKASVSDILERGLRPSDAVSGSNMTLSVKSSGKTVYALVPVPVADYRALNAKLLDNKGAAVVEQILSEYSSDISRAELFSMSVTCDEVAAPPCRINLGGDRTQLQETAEGSSIYEGEFEIPATTSFYVEFDGVPYGFATSSGAGGLGTIKADNSALPVAKIRNAGKSKKTYYVHRAQGTMAPTEIADNPFTIDLESPGKMKVRFDNSDPASPKYNISLVKSEDASVIFHEDFDLCVFGGDYLAPADGKACTSDTYDGYLPANGTVTQNNPCFAFDYPVHVASNDPLPAYMENYGFKDWVFVQAGERPGGIQLCSGSVPGSVTTPALSAVEGSIDAVLEIDIARFSTSSTSPVFFRLLNAGKFTSGSVVRDAYDAASQAGAHFDEATTTYSVFEDDGSIFCLNDDEYFPHSWNNADIDKPVSHYRFEVSGITSSTKIMVDCPKGPSSAPRVFVFDIKVTKK